ncbi:uncharacterized protein TOT_010000939 [Theileria orientalis strain Shintoku]|uniref:Uncharacterized protein n=1 Tax=Theileria orientalis strain Shintoku TaxID=869250 RepID=J4DNS8_THEOR|nr:uncharacterized protein TOT_010000939 [Theileria orientalis strain Shintoku]BAM39484.1 uncharacterized protein TOT_010000939 [Theileria orientalis strain Shintoku]|eukprot:XP_009689785.1 uncharacterized protein TOT_010000939 [Theileria orientalis strain Shintoku]
MRLISYVLFLFCSFGAKFVKAAPTLDLDTYDPEEFTLTLQRQSDYSIEQFTPKSNDQITRVTSSGFELYGGDGSDTVSTVNVYSVRSVPQMVQINLNSGTSTHFQKKGNEYQEVDENQFSQLKGKLDDGSFTANLNFTLNLESKFTPRNLFTKKEHLVDGVNTLVFTPESQPQITLVKEGPFTVATAGTNEHFTRVTVSLNRQRMSLALVESSNNGTSHAYYFHKTSSWKQVDKAEYERLLNALHPVDVYEKVTLDITSPNDQHFQQERDYDGGLTETVYNPKVGYEVKKVTSGSTELWSSNENRSSKVVVFSTKDGVKLVKVELKNPEGNATNVFLFEDQGTFSVVNEMEFSDRVQKLKNELSKQRGQPTSSGTLDVASPNLSEFHVVKRLFKGVHYKEFSRIDGHSIPKVESSGTVVFESTSNVAVTHVNVFMKNGVPSMYQVSGVFANYDSFNSLLKLDQGTPVAVDSTEFNEFIKTATQPPNMFTKLSVNLASPEQDNVAVYTSKVYGLDNTVAQAHDGYYFNEVTFGERHVWSADDHSGVSVTQAVAFRNRAVADEFKLLELEGFKNGTYVTFYYEKLLGGWNSIDQATFQNKFRLLKFPDMAVPPSERQVRKHGPDFVLPPVTPEETGEPTVTEPQEELPGAPTGPEEEVVPTVPETPMALPPAPTEPETQEPPTGPEEEVVPTVPETPMALPPAPTEPETQEPPTEVPASKQLEVVHLDTEHLDESKVSMIAGTDQGYYFKSYSPKDDVYIGSVKGPNGFTFDGRGGRLVTLAKFFWVHSRLIGATLFTVSVNRQGPLEYYYTYDNNEWNYSTSMTKLTERIANETAYTEDQKADLVNLYNQTQKLNETLEKLKQMELKAAEKRRKQEEKENKVVVPKKLSHKTRLYNEMVDMDQVPVPKTPEAVEETEEELEKRRQSYAGGDKILVESELLYFELSNPKTNNYVHTKDYTCMGLPSVDVTPFAGRFVHVVSLHGKRIWVSSNNKRATNLQLFYADEQIVGALLKVTSVVRGTTITGEEFDYLFVKDGELQKVTVNDFMNLANTRFQSAALVSISKLPQGPQASQIPQPA